MQVVENLFHGAMGGWTAYQAYEVAQEAKK